jgi:Zn-dependent M28 family amino/carboxypeptidase
LAGKATKRGDGIFNGANDNASGTTALLTLARYYAARADNERTIIFCAFSGEELGLLGSTLFANKINADAVKAMINVEMIGRAQVGKNRFFITGAQHSTFATILQKGLKDGRMKIVAEPSKEKNLFRRSDNYPFARKGVSAHSIMSSDDDDDCYHQACDEVRRMDTEHMAVIIEAIIIGCQSIIEGTETPSRIGGSKIF